MSRGRLSWIVIGLLAAVFATGSIDLYSAHVLERAQRDRMRHETALIGRWIGAAGVEFDPQELAESAALASLTRVTLIDASGVVVGDSSRSPERLRQMDNHAGRPEVAAAQTSGTGNSIRRSSTTNVTYLYSARRIDGGGPVRIVRVAIPLPDRTRPYRSPYLLLFAATAGFVAILVGYGYYRHRRLVLAVDEMTEAVDSDTNTPTAPGDIERLSIALSRAADRNRHRLVEASSPGQLLAAAVAGMREGLLVIDQELRVRLANRAATEILETDSDPIGTPLSQVTRHPALLEAVEAALGGSPSPQIPALTLETEQRAFEIRVTPLDLDGGGDVLVLLFDVSELRSLQQVRQNFVADISHELRTPLTAIKAAAETILDEGADDRARFSRMIHRNAEAMEALVEDLTDLSLIETGAVTLELIRFDFAQLVRDTVEQTRPIAGDTPIEVSIDEPLPLVGDRRRLGEVLLNLLDNALKFNRPGGDVRIEGHVERGTIVLHVRDTGIGIPATQVETVFHRFHQVAEDRSRKRPGFGLGLAIVKHLVRLHGGQIHVRSEMGAGSTFSLHLPQERP